MECQQLVSEQLLLALRTIAHGRKGPNSQRICRDEMMRIARKALYDNKFDWTAAAAKGSQPIKFY